MLTRLIKYLIRGTLFVLPLLILYWLIVLMSQFFTNIVPGLSGPIALLVGIAFLILIGWITKRTLAKKIHQSLMKRVFASAPLVGNLLRFVHRIPLFNNDNKLDTPVWINMGNGHKKIGFLVHESLPQFDLADHVAVLVPSAFSPQSETIILPIKDIEKINRSAEASLFFAVTGGVVEYTQTESVTTSRDTSTDDAQKVNP